MDLVTFTKEILNEKLHFLYNGIIIIYVLTVIVFNYRQKKEKDSEVYFNDLISLHSSTRFYNQNEQLID